MRNSDFPTKLPYNVGQRVCCPSMMGTGIITHVHYDDESDKYPIHAMFDVGGFKSFTLDGKEYESQELPTLFIMPDEPESEDD